jgi:hypothetical protein
LKLIILYRKHMLTQRHNHLPCHNPVRAPPPASTAATYGKPDEPNTTTIRRERRPQSTTGTTHRRSYIIWNILGTIGLIKQI